MGGLIFFITVWPLMASTNSPGGPGVVEYVGAIVWGAGFIIPIVLQMKKKIGAPWGPTLLIALSPIILTVIVWNVLAQSFS